MTSTHAADATGHFGMFGGQYVPETLMPALAELEAEYRAALDDPDFWGVTGRRATSLEHALILSLRLRGIVPEKREWQFARPRLFRADFAWPSKRLIVEVEGGKFAYGGHNRGVQIDSDCEKSALAAARGLRFMRVSGKQVKSGKAAEWIEAALAWRPETS